MKQQQFYDTDILTDHPRSDMESERDLPKDKLNKKKLLFKDKLYRVFKIIRTPGERYSYHKPAKYDEVIYKHIEISEEQYNDSSFNEAEAMAQAPIKSCNLGYEKEENWLDSALQTMKKDEISIVWIEHLQLDQNDLKILDKNQYMMIQIINWTTIVDLYQDMAYLKRIETKGTGNERVELRDEVQVSVKILYNGQLLLNYQSDSFENLSLESGPITTNVWKVMKTMKPGERAICTIKDEDFRKNEKAEHLEKLLLQVSPQSSAQVWQVDLSIKSMIKVDDIYGDGSLVKKSFIKGKSTAKPDKVSKIIFDLWIYQSPESYQHYPKSEDLLYSSQPDLPDFMQNSVQTQEREKEKENSKKLKQQQDKDSDQEVKVKVFSTENFPGGLEYFIDDIQVSKLLRHCLLRMKKKEIASFTCQQPRDMLKNGFDSKIVKDKLPNLPNTIIYVLRVYDFTEGKNNFTMTVDEKINQTIRKKTYAVDYIKQLQYRKALKVFQTINAYFDYGTFTEEDKQRFRDHQISALLNTSLCQFKLKLWKELIISTTKVLSLQPTLAKAIFRKASALKNLLEYEEAIQSIEQFETLTQRQGANDNDKDLVQEILALKEEIIKKNKHYQSQQKQVYSKMFSYE